MRTSFFSFTSCRVRPIDGILLLIAVGCIVVRFVGLEYAPPAMWIDEWVGASHIGCMAQSGQSGVGERWPLFVVARGGGFVTPVYLYFGALWVRIFGVSPASMRAISAFFVVLTIAGLGLLARRLGGPRLGFWSLVLASLSPWSFQFSRVAWDPPLAPAFVVWGCYFWLLERPVLGGTLAGIMAAFAMYSYPPQRIQVPLLFSCLFFITFRATATYARRSVAFGTCSALLVIPLIRQMLSPAFLERGDSLAIFAQKYLAEHQGQASSSRFIVQTFLDNIVQHLRPSFLFISGDPNIRHSTQSFGELGLLEIFALFLGVWCIASGARGASAATPRRGTHDRRSAWIAVAGMLTGIIPAALTWEGLPHALRAIGAWPFFPLLGAIVLTGCERSWVQLRKVALVIAATHVVLYGWSYVMVYPQLSRDAFTTTLFQSGIRWTQLPAGEKARLARDEAELVRYALMVNGTHHCVEAEQERLRAIAAER